MKHILLSALLSSFLFSAPLELRLIDKESSLVVSKAVISDSTNQFSPDANGTFRFDTNETLLHAKAYGYRPLSFYADANSTNVTVEPIRVKALYLTFWAANATSPRAKKVLDMIEEDAANALVIDIKNEFGSTSFKTSFKQANSYGAHHQRTNRDMEGFMQLMKEKKIYTIARICTFMDDLQATNNPEYAIKKKNGEIWRNHDGMAWVDPFDKRSHEYAIAIAEEAAKAGFDEINFDYIRFPAREGLVYSKESTPQNRIQAIEEFLDKAQKRLRKYGVFISVDTYGNICWAEGEDDNNIGQTVRSMASKADYLAPMLYPSGFANGSFGVKYPSEIPYTVIYKSIANIQDRIDPVRVRPWLQYFKDYAHSKKHYKKFEIQEQVRASRDANTSGWMMWSPSSRYHLSYLREEPKDTTLASNP